MPIITDEKKQNLTLQEVKNKLHKIVQEEKIELRQTIRNANPLFAKVEDGYVEIKDFLKDMTQSLHFHIDLESKKPSINFLDAKAKQFHAPKKDEIKK